MRPLLDKVFFLLLMFIFCSCSSSRNFLGKEKTEFGMIKFYGVNALEAKSLVTKVYAAVDSSGVQMYYSFYSDGILMTDERAKNLFYSVIFKQLPDNPDTNIYRRLSHIDTLVFSKAKELVKTLNNLYLKNPDGATGFEIQVQYMHGFPKKGKFLPL